MEGEDTQRWRQRETEAGTLTERPNGVSLCSVPACGRSIQGPQITTNGQACKGLWRGRKGDQKWTGVAEQEMWAVTT